MPWVTPLDDLNWLSRCTHLRRIIIDVPRGEQRLGVAGQLGRGCPVEMPEGPNIGRILSIARGAEKTLAIIEQLMHLGFDATKRSGASMNPFAGESLPESVKPEPLTRETRIAYEDELKDAIVSRTDYDSDDFGPQLLAVKSGARGNDTQLVAGLVGRVVTDEDYRLFFSRRGVGGGAMIYGEVLCAGIIRAYKAPEKDV